MKIRCFIKLLALPICTIRVELSGRYGLFLVGGYFSLLDSLGGLCAIKSKNEVIADVVALLQSPAKNVISALQGAGQTIHGVLKTLGERPE